MHFIKITPQIADKPCRSHFALQEWGYRYLAPNLSAVKRRLTLWLCFVYTVGIDIFQVSLQINTYFAREKTELEFHFMRASAFAGFSFTFRFVCCFTSRIPK